MKTMLVHVINSRSLPDRPCSYENVNNLSVLALVKTIGKTGLIQLPDELIVNEVFKVDRFALGHVDGFSTVAIPGSVGYCFSAACSQECTGRRIYP